MLWREENPFTGRFQGALSPEKDNDLKRLYVLVDGLRGAEPDINNWVKAAGQPRTKPFVALIFGPKGSGRKSVARYIAYRSAAANVGDATADAKTDLLSRCFVEFRVADEHNLAPTRSLVSKFYNLAISQSIDMGQDLFTKLLEIGPSTTVDAFSNLYTFMRMKSKGGIRVPIFFLDQVRNFEQISVAAQTTDKDAILICTTGLEPVVKDFSKAASDGRFISLQVNLTGLTPEDVVQLYEHRWSTFANEPGAALPIEKAIIERTFTLKWPIKGVVIVLGELLSAYADTSESGSRQSQKPMDDAEVLKLIVALLNRRTSDILG